MQFHHTASLAINSTTIIIIGGIIVDKLKKPLGYDLYPGVTCVNVITNHWTPYPNIPNYLSGSMTKYLAAISFDKKRKRYLCYCRQGPLDKERTPHIVPRIS